jgi:hypothetical protein
MLASGRSFHGIAFVRFILLHRLRAIRFAASPLCNSFRCITFVRFVSLFTRKIHLCNRCILVVSFRQGLLYAWASWGCSFVSAIGSIAKKHSRDIVV